MTFQIPECGTFEEWDEWEVRMKKEHPFRFFIYWTFPIKFGWWRNRLIHDPIHWLKCKLWYKYNTVKCEYLPPTWCDRDWLMVHCCFQLLKDFIEKEKPWEFEATEEEMKDHPRIESWKELRRLYYWWVIYEAFEDTEEVQTNLESLIRIRKIMWS